MFGDRSGGGREGKTHDRRTLRNFTRKVNPFAEGEKNAQTVVYSLPPPPLPARRGDNVADAGAVLISRQLQRDQQRMLQRAMDGGLDFVVCFTQDFDRVGEVQSLVKQYPSFLYAAYGLHPDSIRGNVKTADKRLPELRALATTPECVALFVGLDHSRDMASHFPQEALLKEQLALASELRLPVLLQQVGAAERVAEMLSEHNAAWAEGAGARAKEAAAAAEAAAASTPDPAASQGKPGSKKAGGQGSSAPGTLAAAAALPPWVPRCAIYRFDGDARDLRGYLEAGCSLVITGMLCDDASDPAVRLRALVPRIPLARLLIASNAPADTPASISDHFVRTSRNEPENMPRHLLPALTEAWNAGLGADAPSFAAWLAGGGDVEAALGPDDPRPRLSLAEISSITYSNSVKFFGLTSSSSGAEGGATSGGVGASRSAGAPAGSTGDGETDDGAPSHHHHHGGDEGEALGEGQAPDFPSGSAAGASGAHGPVVAQGDIHYLCRVCRTRLFTGEHVMPHDASGVRPSLAGQVAPATVTAAPASGAGAGSGSDGDDGDGDGRGDGGKRGGKKLKGKAAAAAAAAALEAEAEAAAAAKAAGKAGAGAGTNSKKGKHKKGRRRGQSDSEGSGDEAAPAPAPAPLAKAGGKGRKGAGRGGAGDSDAEGGGEGEGAQLGAGDLHVSRWHEAKGKTVRHRDGGVCRMLLVDRQPWMVLPKGESEGPLGCPGCDAKVGDWSLSGLKCSCGLLVAPAFKVPRSRVDEVLTGVDALEAALAAAELGGEGGMGEPGDDGGSDDDEDRKRGRRVAKTKALAVPVHNYRGNFNLFRNQNTLKVSVGMKNKMRAKEEADAAAGAGDGGAGHGADEA